MLGPGATDDRLARAAAANQREWLARQAAATGGTVRRAPGVTWTVARHGAAVAFPALSPAAADELLDTVVAEARAVGAREVSCWSLLPTRPADLDARLRERGFETGWQAHWLALELPAAPAPAPPPGLDVRVAAPGEGRRSTGLPYDEPGASERRRVLTSSRPRRVWHVVARRDGAVVGHATLSVSTGRLGVAGVYDVGVRPDERRRGIGTALTRAVCALGLEAGCGYATLNATHEGELLYRSLGFRSVGVAQTWWLHLPPAG